MPQQRLAKPSSGRAARHLVVDVRFLLERYHGEEWPPSPRRLFLALVSSLYQSPPGQFARPDGDRALKYLEMLDPPRIEAVGAKASPYTLFVPNNDWDLVAKNIEKNRALTVDPRKYTTSKRMQPYAATAVRYVWDVRPDGEADQGALDLLCRLAKAVPVLGWGIDPVAVNCETHDAVGRLDGATSYAPAAAGADMKIDVPAEGLLDDAKRRYGEFARQVSKKGFAKPGPITAHREADYEQRRPARRLLVFRLDSEDRRFATPRQAPELTRAIRDLCGRELGDAAVVPLPTIGSPHADTMIRRAGIVVPPSMSAEHLLRMVDSQFVKLGDGRRFQLVRAPDDDRVGRYYQRPSRVWRSVTPLEAGGDRRGAADLVMADLEKRGMSRDVLSIRLDKVPDWDGLERLPDAAPRWYAEIELRHDLRGPLVVGTGTDRGSGVMAPAQLPEVAYYAVVGSRPHVTQTIEIASMMRDAVMSKAGRLRRDGWVSQRISGHDDSRRPLRANHEHAYWLPVDNDRDGLVDHIAVYIRYGIEPSARRAFSDVTRIYNRGGTSARVRFAGFHHRADMARRCILFKSGTRWVTATPYFMPWHAKKNFGAAEQIQREASEQRIGVVPADTDAAAAIPTRGGAVPIKSFQSARHGKAPAAARGRHVSIRLAGSKNGPVLLGANSHFGMGMFVPFDP